MTLIELLVVSAILGILTSVATPSYLGFRDNANKTAASANVYAIVPDIEWYAFDNYAGSPASRDPDYNGSDAAYTGTNADTGYQDINASHDFMSILQSKYDPSIASSKYTWDPAGWSPAAGSTDATDFCVYTTVGPVLRGQARACRSDHHRQDDAPRRQRRLLRLLARLNAVLP